MFNKEAIFIVLILLLATFNSSKLTKSDGMKDFRTLTLSNKGLPFKGVENTPDNDIQEIGKWTKVKPTPISSPNVAAKLDYFNTKENTSNNIRRELVRVPSEKLQKSDESSSQLKCQTSCLDTKQREVVETSKNSDGDALTLMKDVLGLCKQTCQNCLSGGSSLEECQKSFIPEQTNQNPTNVKNRKPESKKVPKRSISQKILQIKGRIC